ncbi:hypothetical protein KR067_010536 [Drosophila pandora]|nr:hypothetical protein KR067_010536 [Drosophila pandora]
MFPNTERQDLKCAGDCMEPGTLTANREILWRNREVPDVRVPPPTSSSSIEKSVNDERAGEVLTSMKSFDRLRQKLRTSFYQDGQRRKKCSQLKPHLKSTATPAATPPPPPQPCPPTSTTKSSEETTVMTSSQESTTRTHRQEIHPDIEKSHSQETPPGIEKTHSQEVAKLKEQIDLITDGIHSLQTWIPILDDQHRLLVDENRHLDQESFTSINNTPKELISEWDMQDDDLPAALQDLEHNKWDFRRNHSRDHYCGLHVHLANMLLVPKSETSFHLNQLRNLKTSLRFSLGQWRPEFTSENRSKDLAAAEYLKRSRNPSKHSKNVRRQ